MAAIDASIYEEFNIESADQSQSADLKAGVIAFSYYEDVMSPVITATAQIVNTGNSIKGKSIYQGLPLRGGERVSIKVRGNSRKNPGLDFTKKKDYFFVTSIDNVESKSKTESFTLQLTSREAISNETTRVGKRYPSTSKISDSVKDILEKTLQTKKKLDIHETQNPYGFIGNQRKPFTVIGWLASKAVPDVSEKDGTAGYFFYQTRDSYNFHSVDKMMTKKPKATYTWTEVALSKQEKIGDYNIQRYQTTRNNNLLAKLRAGAYSSQRIFFDPLNFTFTGKEAGLFNSTDAKTKNLGKKLVLPKINDESDKHLGNLPSRIVTQVMDRGTLSIGVTIDENADPMKYQSQALSRLNTLFTQVLDMNIPSNTNLRAGDIIKCQFPQTAVNATNEFDADLSGLYMIKSLRHFFNPDGSWTQMNLVRDTYGQHGTNTK